MKLYRVECQHTGYGPFSVGNVAGPYDVDIAYLDWEEVKHECGRRHTVRRSEGWLIESRWAADDPEARGQVRYAMLTLDWLVCIFDEVIARSRFRVVEIDVPNNWVEKFPDGQAVYRADRVESSRTLDKETLLEGVAT